MNYRIVSLPTDYTTRLRNTGTDDLSQPVENHIANGGEPCRDVLRRANPGEELILASYCPFSQAGPYKEYGPVFILADQSQENAPAEAFTLSSMTETGYLSNTFVLKAYCKNERIIHALLVTPDNAEAILSELFQDSETAFVIARYAAYGCYSLRIERRLQSPAYPHNNSRY